MCIIISLPLLLLIADAFHMRVKRLTIFLPTRENRRKLIRKGPDNAGDILCLATVSKY